MRWISLGLLAAVVLGLAWWIFSDRSAAGPSISDYERAVARADSLERLLTRRDSLFRPPSGLSDWEVRRLQERGLADPVEQLVDSLVQHPDLIPYDGVVGGTMAFRPPAVHILSGRWIFAGFDDGHIAGHMLVEYSVSRDGSISWDVVEAYLQ